MKHLFRAIFEKLIGKPLNIHIHKKSNEKEESFDGNNFVAYYEPRRTIIFFILFLVCSGVTVGFYSVDKKIDVWVTVCCVFSVVVFFVLIYLLTYRCYVDDTGFTVTKFFVLRKHIARQEFCEVEVISWQPKDSDSESLLIVKNEKGKRIFTSSRDVIGFNFLCKKAKRFKRKKNG